MTDPATSRSQGDRSALPSYGPSMLEMRETCEKCETVLPVDGDARICSFECTFCSPCTDAMAGVCPNCGGELIARPKRAAAG